MRRRPDRTVGPGGRRNTLTGRSGGSAPSRTLRALIPEELLDLGDEVVAGGEALLVDHRFETLDVGPGVVVRGRRRVEACPELLGLVDELAPIEGQAKVPLHGDEELDGGRRVRAADVVRDLGEVADRV